MTFSTAEEHIESLNLHPPRFNDEVFKDDCAYTFDTPESPFGLDVCLSCFTSSSPDPSHNYTSLHYQLTKHSVYLNIRKIPKPQKAREESPNKIAKLAIEADKEEDHFEIRTKVKDLEFADKNVDEDNVKGLNAVIEGIMKATSYAKKEEIQAWEQEIIPCEHILYLEQEEKRDIDSETLSHCSQCDLKENLWFCLSCGNLGCGRAQFGGVGGNGHGLNHFEQTGHIASVKLGSISADGNADVFCYKCGDEVNDPNLTDHLHYWGINIAEREKTEKSLTELQIEQNLKWDFSMTTEDGKELEPLFGKGLTGMKNLGNSCYLSSVVQCLFSLEEFQTRFSINDEGYKEYIRSQRDPAHNLEIQLRKLADGLLSGRYSNPDNAYDESKYQRGISPGMFKSLIGKGHFEFSTMRQQDAFEFLIHLLDKISELCKTSKLHDPTNIFKFQTERRLECKNCHKVRYRVENQENISIPVPIRKLDNDSYQTINIIECLEIFSAPEEIDYKCKSCNESFGAISSTKFKTFPEVLILNARRFQVINWVPQKLDIPVNVPNEPLKLDDYLSLGPQSNEDVVVDDKEDEDNEGSNQENKFVPNVDALISLESMGFPKVRCEKALYHTGNSDAEAATNWLFEHMEDPDIDEPLFKDSSSVSAESINQLIDMGFTDAQARFALKKTGSVEASIEYLFSNPDVEVEEPHSTPSDPISTPISYGDATTPANYNLKSIICHKGGSIHAGHYVAFINKQTSSSQSDWVLFNDEKVVRGGEADEMKKFAYVYLFERIR